MSITLNGVLRQDPTRTLTLRRSFEGQMNKRFALLKREIVDAIVAKDVFGLVEREHTLSVNYNPNHDPHSGRFTSGGVTDISNIPVEVTGRVYQVDARQLNIEVYSKSKVNEYKAKIRAGETPTPSFISKDPTTGVLNNIVDGSHRAQAFKELKRPVPVVVVNRLDALVKLASGVTPEQYFRGLQGIRNIKTNLEPRQFEFSRSDQKIKGFMDWLKEMERKDILTMSTKPGVFMGEQPWTNVYVQSAYQRGISRARQELRKKGYDVPRGEGPLNQDSIGVAFNQPFHADRVAMLYTRTFNELEGITNAMDQQISRVLAQGMVEGRNPRQIARDIVDRVDNIGITRARTLARTEIISAHHQATINEYEQWGVRGVGVQAEWLTAGFKVCPLCSSLQGKVFTLQAIRGMIPAHPNCRCCAIPVIKEA